MALPPIISNLPIIKLLRSEQSSAVTGDAVKAGAPNHDNDIVEISEAARQKLSETEPLSSDNLAQVREVAAETRSILENTDFSLGLGPDFAG